MAMIDAPLGTDDAVGVQIKIRLNLVFQLEASPAMSICRWALIILTLCHSSKISLPIATRMHAGGLNRLSNW